MRLLIVGSENEFAIENFYKKYLRESGVSVEVFTSANLFHKYYYQSIFNKIIYRAGLSPILKRINTRLKEKMLSFRPDVVWLFKGMEITAETLKWIKQQSIPLVNYNPDNPFIFTGRGSGNRNITDSLPLFDLYFTYNLEIKEELEKRYKTRTEFLPFGFDVPDTLYQACNEQEEVNKVCFLGNPDKNRAHFIGQLLQQGIAIDVFGNDWDKFIAHENLSVHGEISGETFWKVLRRYRIQLNLMRIHNLRSHNMRTFEVPGIGGIQLAPDTPEHRKFFEPGHEIFLFRDINECVEKIHFLGSLPAEEAKAIRSRAREKSITAKYTYKDRAQFALDTIRAISNR